MSKERRGWITQSCVMIKVRKIVNVSQENHQKKSSSRAVMIQFLRRKIKIRILTLLSQNGELTHAKMLSSNAQISREIKQIKTLSINHQKWSLTIIIASSIRSFPSSVNSKKKTKVKTFTSHMRSHIHTLILKLIFNRQKWHFCKNQIEARKIIRMKMRKIIINRKVMTMLNGKLSIRRIC